jgi:hypothetical protein
MMRAAIIATVIEMDDGRPVLLVEMEPDAERGLFVVDPLGEAAVPADEDFPEGIA